MSDIKRINNPLIRELQELGVLSTDATPVIIGNAGAVTVTGATMVGASIRVNTESFDGDGTKAKTADLAQVPVGVVSAVAYPDDGSGFKITALVESTDFDIVDGTAGAGGTKALQYITPWTDYRVVMTYTY
jgi:hypothetical protein